MINSKCYYQTYFTFLFLINIITNNWYCYEWNGNILKNKDHHDDHEAETFMVPDSSIYVRPAFIPNQRLEKHFKMSTLKLSKYLNNPWICYFSFRVYLLQILQYLLYLGKWFSCFRGDGNIWRNNTSLWSVRGLWNLSSKPVSAHTWLQTIDRN